MNWYYFSERQEVGPLSVAALEEIHASGCIADETPVRREDSAEWQAYANTFSSQCETHRNPDPTCDRPSYKFHCIHCQQRIAAEEDCSGKTVQCPTCGGDFVVPQPPEEMESINPHRGVLDKGQSPDIPSSQKKSIAYPAQAPGTSNSLGKQGTAGPVVIKQGKGKSRFLTTAIAAVIVTVVTVGALFITKAKSNNATTKRDAPEADRNNNDSGKQGAASEKSINNNRSSSYHISYLMEGYNYYSGKNGKTKDYVEAVKWFRKAAEQGGSLTHQMVAQQMLGECYYNGKGVECDYSEAAKWYYKSASQGNLEAQLMLGKILILGLGVKVDENAAYMWVNRACDSNDQEMRIHARQIRDEIERKMNSADLAEAQRASREWRPGSTSYGKPIFLESKPLQKKVLAENPKEKKTIEESPMLPWEKPPYSLSSKDGKESTAEQWLQEDTSNVLPVFTDFKFGMTLEDFKSKYSSLKEEIKKDAAGNEFLVLESEKGTDESRNKSFYFSGNKLVAYKYFIARSFGEGSRKSSKSMQMAEDLRISYVKEIKEKIGDTAKGNVFSFRRSENLPDEFELISFTDSMGSLQSSLVGSMGYEIMANASVYLVSREYIMNEYVPMLDWYLDVVAQAIQKDESEISTPYSFCDDFGDYVHHHVLQRALVACLVKRFGGISTSITQQPSHKKSWGIKTNFETQKKIKFEVNQFDVEITKPIFDHGSDRNDSVAESTRTNRDSSETPLAPLAVLRNSTIEEAKECVRLLDEELGKNPGNERASVVKNVIMNVFKSEASLIAAVSGTKDAEEQYRIKMQNLQVASRPSPLTGRVNTTEIERIRREAEAIKTGSEGRVRNAKSALKRTIEEAIRSAPAPDSEALSRVWDQIERRNNL